MKLLTKILFVIFALFLSYTCDSTNPRLEPDLFLKLEGVSCTEAWLLLTTNNIQLPVTINLLKNNSISQIFNLSTKDSLIFIDSLLPNQTYKILATIQQTNKASIELSVITMDTTSQNFTWQTFEFGIQTNVSILFDVAIIEENNIWAVGEIYMNDSLGNPDPTSYNAVHWNGQSWELKKIAGYGGWACRTVFAFSENDVWFEGTIKWDGINYSVHNYGFPLEPNGDGWQINKLWGSNNNDLYVVGNNGNTAHYNGTSFSKIYTGTDLSLLDIAVHNSGEVFICGGNPSFGQGIILKSSVGDNFSTFIEGANIPESQLFNPKLYGAFSSLWFDQNNTLYAGGNILFQYKFNRWSYVKSLPDNYIGGNPNTYYRGFIDKVRGNASNDMWIVGDRNTVRHFNGVTWRQIGMPYDPQVDMVWRGMDCKDNLTVLVGSHDNKAIIMMIKK